MPVLPFPAPDLSLPSKAATVNRWDPMAYLRSCNLLPSFEKRLAYVFLVVRCFREDVAHGSVGARVEAAVMLGMCWAGWCMWTQAVVMEVGNGSRRQLRDIGLWVLSRQHPAHRLSLCVRDYIVLYFTASPVR